MRAFQKYCLLALGLQRRNSDIKKLLTKAQGYKLIIKARITQKENL